MRDEIQLARSPLIRGNEFPEGYRNNLGLTKRDPENEANAYAYVYANRMKTVWEALQDFDAQSLEAEALWGTTIRTCTNELRTILQTLNAAQEAFIANVKAGGADFKMDQDFGKKIRSEISSSPTSLENPLNISLNAAIRSLENALRPHLRRA